MEHIEINTQRAVSEKDPGRNHRALCSSANAKADVRGNFRTIDRESLSLSSKSFYGVLTETMAEARFSSVSPLRRREAPG